MFQVASFPVIVYLPTCNHLLCPVATPVSTCLLSSPLCVYIYVFRLFILYPHCVVLTSLSSLLLTV